jgi:hypothetical protein
MSQVITLEDSYRNRYQQLWDFGMDFITFMLDAVIPFWRNYGKVIGVDVQDFLIIPWYRNEFTGEAKRYSIDTLPKRSFRHWIGLLTVFSMNVLLVRYQALGVWVSCRLHSLPFQSPPVLWLISVPMFWTFVCMQIFFVVLEAVIMITQIIVVLWWLAWWARIVD